MTGYNIPHGIGLSLCRLRIFRKKSELTPCVLYTQCVHFTYVLYTAQSLNFYNKFLASPVQFSGLKLKKNTIYGNILTS